MSPSNETGTGSEFTAETLEDFGTNQEEDTPGTSSVEKISEVADFSFEVLSPDQIIVNMVECVEKVCNVVQVGIVNNA
jgi:hypothetical protein